MSENRDTYSGYCYDVDAASAAAVGSEGKTLAMARTVPRPQLFFSPSGDEQEEDFTSLHPYRITAERVNDDGSPTDALVEVVARVTHANTWEPHGSKDWDDLYERTREMYRDMARAAIAAMWGEAENEPEEAVTWNCHWTEGVLTNYKSVVGVSAGAVGLSYSPSNDVESAYACIASETEPTFADLAAVIHERFGVWIPGTEPEAENEPEEAVTWNCHWTEGVLTNYKSVVGVSAGAVGLSYSPSNDVESAYACIASETEPTFADLAAVIHERFGVWIPGNHGAYSARIQAPVNSTDDERDAIVARIEAAIRKEVEG